MGHPADREVGRYNARDEGGGYSARDGVGRYNGGHNGRHGGRPLQRLQRDGA